MQRKIIVIMLVMLAVSGAVLAQEETPPAMPPMPEIDGEIVVEGLSGPQGVYVDDTGAVWVIDSGTGGEETIDVFNFETGEVEPLPFGMSGRLLRLTETGEVEQVVTLPSVVLGTDFVSAARMVELNDTLYLTVGFWQGTPDSVPPDQVDIFGSVARLTEDGELEEVADLWAYEAENNPDQTTNYEAHPYDITAGPDGLLYIADAAANALYTVNPEDGTINTVAVFDPLPGVFPNPFRNNELLTDPVPTGVVVRDDETAYVSFLSGAPFIPGSAKVVSVTPEGVISDYTVGLTMLTDLVEGPDNNLYATSFGMFTEEGPVFNSGSVIRILADGSAETVVEGLPFPTSIDFNAEGDAYVVINGAGAPGTGAVVLYEGLTEMEGTPIEMSLPSGD